MMIYDSFISILVFSLSCIHFSVAAPVISYNVKSDEDKVIQKQVTGKTISKISTDLPILYRSEN